MLLLLLDEFVPETLQPATLNPISNGGREEEMVSVSE